MKFCVKQCFFVTVGICIIGAAVFFGKFHVADAGVKTTSKQTKNAAIKKDQKFEDWVVSCTEDEQKKQEQVCFLNQQVMITKEGKQEVIAIYQIGYFNKQQGLQMVQLLPLGVNLPAGTSIIGKDKQLLSPGKYSFCTSVGCSAVADISDKDLDLFLESDKNMLGFINQEGKQINLPISVKGLKTGLEALRGEK